MNKSIFRKVVLVAALAVVSASLPAMAAAYDESPYAEIASLVKAKAVTTHEFTIAYVVEASFHPALVQLHLAVVEVVKANTLFPAANPVKSGAISLGVNYPALVAPG